MKIIDIEYDYRLDSKCGDPDTDSPKLYKIQSQLWNKEVSENRRRKSYSNDGSHDREGLDWIKRRRKENLIQLFF